MTSNFILYNDTNKILNTNNHTRTNIDYNVSEVYGLIILLSIGLFIICCFNKKRSNYNQL
jgi:hypothetical protein